jgi:hypothetical protein
MGLMFWVVIALNWTVELLNGRLRILRVHYDSLIHRLTRYQQLFFVFTAWALVCILAGTIWFRLFLTQNCFIWRNFLQLPLKTALLERQNLNSKIFFQKREKSLVFIMRLGSELETINLLQADLKRHLQKDKVKLIAQVEEEYRR